MNDPFHLQRFLDAQAPVLEQVRAELHRGEKETHWMWFVFPQLAGLGRSDMARRYAISSRAEAQAYLAHPILGPRLMKCTRLVNAVQGRSLEAIFGPIDALKFRSSMTLFAAVAAAPSVFHDALQQYCGGQPDAVTLDQLGQPR